MKKIKYGIFGLGEVERDDNGYIEVPVIIQESGLYVGVPPKELRIRTVGFHDEPDFNKQYCAKLNRNTDLPFYLTKAKIKVFGEMKKYTDEDLIAEGIEPLKESQEGDDE